MEIMDFATFRDTQKHKCFLRNIDDFTNKFTRNPWISIKSAEILTFSDFHSFQRRLWNLADFYGSYDKCKSMTVVLCKSAQTLINQRNSISF